MKQKIRAALLRLTVVYVCYLVVFVCLQRVALYPGRFIDPPPNPPDDAAVWTRVTDVGEVQAYYYGVQTPRGQVVFMHGNGELIDHQFFVPTGYRKLGFGVLLPEFRGYGRSAGSPSQWSVTDDLRHFVARLKREQGGPIVCHGFSLGGAAVGTILGDELCDAVILESTFTSTAEVAKWHPVPDFMFFDPYPTLEVLSASTTPLLIMHGTADAIVAFEHGARLAEARPDARFERFEGAEHNIPRNKAYWGIVEEFVSVPR